jgi:hypothetical protein
MILHGPSHNGHVALVSYSHRWRWIRLGKVRSIRVPVLTRLQVVSTTSTNCANSVTAFHIIDAAGSLGEVWYWNCTPVLVPTRNLPFISCPSKKSGATRRGQSASLLKRSSSSTSSMWIGSLTPRDCKCVVRTSSQGVLRH